MLKTLIEPPYCTSPDAVNHFVNNACTTAASERRKGIFHEGLLPMNIAAKEGKTRALKFLIANGGKVNNVDEKGRSPMYFAAKEGKTKALKLLIANGGKVNMVHADGATAVIVASGWGQTAALKVLLENGGDVHLALDNGCTAVYIASQGDNPEALKLLIKYKADVNKAAGVGRRRVAAGSTPVFIAAKEGSAGALKVLIKNGGNVHQADEYGDTPAFIASKEGQAEALHLLLKAGADAKATRGMVVGPHSLTTALHAAAYGSHTDAVKILAERWPTNPEAWWMFVLGAGVESSSALFLSNLYNVSGVMRFIFSFLHKPRYVSVNQVDDSGWIGKTALQMVEKEMGEGMWIGGGTAPGGGMHTVANPHLAMASLLRRLVEDVSPGAGEEARAAWTKDLKRELKALRAQKKDDGLDRTEKKRLKFLRGLKAAATAWKRADVDEEVRVGQRIVW